MNENIVIRQAREDDRFNIVKCVKASYEKYVERIGKKPIPMLMDYREVITNDTVYVLECENQLAGVLVLINKEEYILLDNIAVAPDFQGKSFGKQLMEFAEIYTKENGKNEIRLYTNEKCMRTSKYITTSAL
jgi:GNAT superfamily N-acetyltransferase